MPTATSTATYWSQRAACLHLGVTPYMFMRHVAMGRIQPKIELGRDPSYAKVDVEKLARELAAEGKAR